MSRDIIFYRTHLLSPAVLAEYERLRKSCAAKYDVALLYHGATAAGTEGLANCHRFTTEDIVALGFPFKDLWNNGHYPLLWYLKTVPNSYQRFWMVEYDVRFTGEWLDVFEHFADDDTDFISVDHKTYEQEPDWDQWPNVPESLSPRRYKSFFPLIRISARA